MGLCGSQPDANLANADIKQKDAGTEEEGEDEKFVKEGTESASKPPPPSGASPKRKITHVKLADRKLKAKTKTKLKKKLKVGREAGPFTGEHVQVTTHTHYFDRFKMCLPGTGRTTAENEGRL